MERPKRRLLCKRCEKFFNWTEGRQLRGTHRVGICLACLTAWQAGGSTCVICQRPVQGQEIGYFPEQKGIGHYECGGIAIDG